MKVIVVLVLVAAGVGGFFAIRERQERAAERALKESLCAGELNDEVMAHAKNLATFASEGRGPMAGMAAVGIRQRMMESSLGPHYSALQRMGDRVDLAQIKRLAAEASVMCPDRFPEANSSEKLVAFTIMLCTPPAP